MRKSLLLAFRDPSGALNSTEVMFAQVLLGGYAKGSVGLGFFKWGKQSGYNRITPCLIKPMTKSQNFLY